MTPEQLDTTGRYLLGGAKAPSTIASYEAIQDNYKCFLANFDYEHLEMAVCKYICTLFDNTYKGSTITSTISTLSYVCSLNGLEDYTKFTLIEELLKGVRARIKTADDSKPITSNIGIDYESSTLGDDID